MTEAKNGCDSHDGQQLAAMNYADLSHDNVNNDAPCCNFCEKRFSSKGNLNKHYKTVHKDMNPEESTGSVRCLEPQCNYTCRYISSLREHLRLKHFFNMDILQIAFPSLKGLCTSILIYYTS